MDEDELVSLYFEDLERQNVNPVSREEETVLFKRAKSGDERALEEIIKANSRFVIATAKTYRGRGVSFPDLIGCGNLGLADAVYRFDESRGLKFISYAVWRIKMEILKAIHENRRISRPPMDDVNGAFRLMDDINLLSQRLGRFPYSHELTEEGEYSEEEIYNFRVVFQEDLSLDSPEGESLLATLGGDGFSKVVDAEVDFETLRNAMKGLDPRERFIIRRYYGLDGKPLTQKEIGDVLGVCDERVRQLREEAIGYLRERLGEYEPAGV